MLKVWVIKTLKAILLDSDNKQAIMKSLDKAVKDTKNPIDDKAAEILKATYDLIIGVL